jgi:hypothetical protein
MQSRRTCQKLILFSAAVYDAKYFPSGLNAQPVMGLLWAAMD